MGHKWRWAFALGLLAISLIASATLLVPGPQWSEAELRKIRSLWIGSLPPLPPDPSDRVADDPQAAALGRKIFSDTRFSLNDSVVCATCHQPQHDFQDGLPLGKGLALTQRRTPPLSGVAYGPWYFWDGRKD